MRTLFTRMLLAALLAVGCSPDTPGTTPPPPPSTCVDNDKDGADSCADCDDSDPNVLPGAKEVCGDGKDNNCDKQVDEGCSGAADVGPKPGTDGGGGDGGGTGGDAGTTDGGGGSTDGGGGGDGATVIDDGGGSTTDGGVSGDGGTTGDAGGGPCKAGDPPKPCGETGSTCVQACVNGALGACQPPTGPVDTLKDPKNCGQCGKVCPVPAHAAATCVKGACGRGPCEAGYFDIDLAKTFGCESKCVNKTCTDSVGNTVTVTNDPLPESGAVFQSLVSGSSYGGGVQTSASNTNMGSLGEALGGGGTVEAKSATHKNYGGFTAAEKR